MIKKYRKILILSFTILSITGCTKKEKGKEVLIRDNNTIQTSTQKEEINSNALDIINGKCIIIKNEDMMYPIIIEFGRDYYIEYSQDTYFGSIYNVLDVKVDNNIVTYSVEKFDHDNTEYSDIKIEVIDNKNIRYINNNKISQSYKLISKSEDNLDIQNYIKNTGSNSTTNNKNSDYIIYDSDSRLLTKEELYKYSKKELAYIRNEIFARHGYIFKSDEYIRYFNEKTWYTPNANFNGNINDFSLIEKKNINLIKDLEESN